MRVAARRASGVKMGDKGGGSLISPDGVAPSRIVSVSGISPCAIKSIRRFLLSPAHPDSPGNRAVKRVRTCGLSSVVSGSEQTLRRRARLLEHGLHGRLRRRVHSQNYCLQSKGLKTALYLRERHAVKLV